MAYISLEIRITGYPCVYMVSRFPVTISSILGKSLIWNRLVEGLESTPVASRRYPKSRILLMQVTAVDSVCTLFPRALDPLCKRFSRNELVSMIMDNKYGQSISEELSDTVLAGKLGFFPSTFIRDLYLSCEGPLIVGVFVWGVLSQTVLDAFVRIKKVLLGVILLTGSSILLGPSVIRMFLSHVKGRRHLFGLPLLLILPALKPPE